MEDTKISGLNNLAIKLFCILLGSYIYSVLIGESILPWNSLIRSQSHDWVLGWFLKSDSKQVKEGSIFMCKWLWNIHTELYSVDDILANKDRLEGF